VRPHAVCAQGGLDAIGQRASTHAGCDRCVDAEAGRCDRDVACGAADVAVESVCGGDRSALGWAQPDERLADGDQL
jgi:hypothetical protein